MKIPKVTHNGLTFINIGKPDKEEIHYLHKHFGFTILTLEDFLYKTQIPKIETYDEYTLVVMDFPYFESASKKGSTKRHPVLASVSSVIPESIPFPRFTRTIRRKRMAIGEVDFFIGKDYVVVLHDEKTPQIDDLFDMCQVTSTVRDDLMSKGPSYLFYRIADMLVDSSIAVVNDISSRIDSIDRDLLEKRSVTVVENISVTRRDLVVFETMIKPALPLFADLERGRYPKLNGEMTMYWSNILDHLQKIWDRLSDNRELIEGIASSYESLLSVRNNEIVKVLTMFTAILLPLTLLASLYGMNISLPLGHHPAAFWYLGGTMITMAVGMVILFKYQEWL